MFTLKMFVGYIFIIQKPFDLPVMAFKNVKYAVHVYTWLVIVLK